MGKTNKITRWHAGQGLAVLTERAVPVFDAAGLLIFPTETFYGLAVRADNDAARAKLLQLKERQQRPVPMIVSSLAVADTVVELTGVLRVLAEAFWPGPLTLVAPPRVTWAKAWMGDARGGLGLRWSAHPVAEALAAAAGGAISATSANWRGQPPAATIAELDTMLCESVDMICDAGQLPGGQPSTVLVRSESDPEQVLIARPGAISAAQLADVLGYEPALLPAG